MAEKIFECLHHKIYGAYQINEALGRPPLQKTTEVIPGRLDLSVKHSIAALYKSNQAKVLSFFQEVITKLGISYAYNFQSTIASRLSL